MKKYFLIIALFVFLFCTLAAAQTRRIEAKKKYKMNSPEFVFNVGHSGWGLSVCYSTDRKYVVSEADEQTIKI